MKVIQGEPVKDLYGLYDPSLVGGYRLIYDTLIPFSIRYVDFNQEVKQFSQQQDLKVRILMKGTDSNPGHIRIELQNSNDLFFNWQFNCDHTIFEEMKQKQNFSNSFQEFTTVLIKCFNRLHTDKGKYLGLITIYSHSKLNLCVIQCSEYKNIEVFNLDFVTSTEERVAPTISYKYERVSREVELAENRLELIYEIIKDKNPSLLLELEKIKYKK